MNKSQLIRTVTDKLQIPERMTKMVLQTALDTIVEAAAEHEDVRLSGFGTFTRKHRRQRVGRDPLTRTAITIPERDVPCFVPSSRLLDAVKGSSVAKRSRKLTASCTDH